jgi:hypothetical protein
VSGELTVGSFQAPAQPYLNVRSSSSFPAAGSADNVVASGQEIAVNRSGSEIGFLDTATYGPAQGQGTIIYADGSTQSFTLNVPDWYSGPPTGWCCPT